MTSLLGQIAFMMLMHIFVIILPHDTTLDANYKLQIWRNHVIFLPWWCNVINSVITMCFKIGFGLKKNRFTSLTLLIVYSFGIPK